ETESPPRPGPWRLAVAAVATLAVAALAYLGWTHRPTHSAEAVRQPVPVARAAIGDLRQEVALSGEFRPYQEVDVDAKVKGYVRTIKVDIGDRVAAGQLLAELEIPEARHNLNRAAAAEARAEQQSLRSHALALDARAVYGRLAEVSKQRPDLIAQQELEEAKAKADAATAAETADRAAVEEATAQHREYEDLLRYSTISAPFAGMITRLYANVGALVGDSGGRGQIVHLSELARLRLVFKVPESAVPSVKEGEPVTVTIPAINVTRQLPIARVSHQLDLSTRTMHVEVDYPNSDNAVTPGLYADVLVPVAQRHRILVIPLEAVAGRRDQSGRVTVLHSDGTIETRAVTLGLVTPTEAEVLSGVHPDEMLVLGARPPRQAGVIFTPQFVPARAK
ncbi:MAG TPA: efflux RND transporter periplasmic adaptor subunit, partial [Steroidobacteraceae bacterium]|nr:efflux RND transporter periplasmic adaptor subunit [Steroidobacteraceae bacterium]